MAMESKENNKKLSYLIFREYIPGCSLKMLLESNSFNVSGGLKLLRHIGLSVFSVLSELHSVEVLHRDVRSEKVYVSGESVKVIGASLDVRLVEIIDGDFYCDRYVVFLIFCFCCVLMSFFFCFLFIFKVRCGIWC